MSTPDLHLGDFTTITMDSKTTMTQQPDKVDTSDELIELAIELVEHWQVQSRAARENGDKKEAAQFAAIGSLCERLINRLKRAEADLKVANERIAELEDKPRKLKCPDCSGPIVPSLTREKVFCKSCGGYFDRKYAINHNKETKG